MAHFQASVNGSKSDQRVAHFLVDVYTPNFCEKFEYIICDELHNLISFSKIKPTPNIHTLAKLGLEQVVTNDTTTVIALTSTPRKIYSFFHADCHTLLVDPTELLLH